VVMALVPLVVVKVFVTTAATGSTHPKRPSRYLFMAFASPLPRLFAITALLHIGDGCPTHNLFTVSWHRVGCLTQIPMNGGSASRGFGGKVEFGNLAP